MNDPPEIYTRHPEELIRDQMRACEYVRCFEGMSGGAPVVGAIAEAIPLSEYSHHADYPAYEAQRKRHADLEDNGRSDLPNGADFAAARLFLVCESGVGSPREWIVDMGNHLVDGQAQPEASEEWRHQDVMDQNREHRRA